MNELIYAISISTEEGLGKTKCDGATVTALTHWAVYMTILQFGQPAKVTWVPLSNTLYIIALNSDLKKLIKVCFHGQ